MRLLWEQEVAGSNPAAPTRSTVQIGGIARDSETVANATDSADEQKALALPNQVERADVTPLPMRPEVRVLDLLRAIDGAVIAGDLHAARALVAAAVRRLEGEGAEANGTRGGKDGGQ